MLLTEGTGGELGTGHPCPTMHCSAQPDKDGTFLVPDTQTLVLLISKML